MRHQRTISMVALCLFSINWGVPFACGLDDSYRTYSHSAGIRTYPFPNPEIYEWFLNLIGLIDRDVCPSTDRANYSRTGDRYPHRCPEKLVLPRTILYSVAY